MDWHQKTADVTLRDLDSRVPAGLPEDEVVSRLGEYGPNELEESSGRRPWHILLEQLGGAMIVLLYLASAVSLFLGEYTDATVIMAIVVLNAALGFVQDYRAEKALAALKKMAVPQVRVRRGGVVQEVSSGKLVPGDVVLLEVGNYVPADCRLLESFSLKIQESALTGESVPVAKQVEPLPDDHLPLGDRTNMAYMGTFASYGHGLAVVTETGMRTELGHIARSLQAVKSEPTPLQLRLAHLGRILALVAMGIVLLVFTLGLLRDEDPKLMLMTALSLAVAVVPEGLPAVATVALALGARRMFRRHALIRKLPAVETLGSVTVICSDKTGTLTQNRMTVTELVVADERLELASVMQPQTRFIGPTVCEEVIRLRQRVTNNSSLALLLAGAGLCNDAELVTDDERCQFRGVGDPTEVAMAIAAANLGLHKNELSKRLPREAEVAFDSDRKRMTTVHRVTADQLDGCDAEVCDALDPILQHEGDHIAFTKGALDPILEECQYVWNNGATSAIDELLRQRIVTEHEEMASRGMRVLGVAFHPIDQIPDANSQDPANEIEHDLVYLGMVGMLDPPRAEVAEAVARCSAAGVRPLMITGDHPLTAIHVAKQLGIASNDQVLSGQELEHVSDDELSTLIKTTSVFARVAPKHKLRLVKTLQDQGHVVAMTGDGVNDAPALKQAHIGVAMGIMGTDVSKEASQMILLDDNFATIVGAIEEGRIAYDNIRKFVQYTMTSNAGEIWVMVLGPLLGMPLPLLPLQILWINLVTDGLPGLALATEKAEGDTMQRPPHPPTETVLGRGMGWDIAWIGLLMGAVSIAMGYWYWAMDSANEAHWRTIVFTVLTLAQMGNALATRSSRDSLFKIGIWTNPALIGSIALTFALQLAVIYWTPLQEIFKTTSLSGSELLICIVLSTSIFWAVELRKLVSRSVGK